MQEKKYHHGDLKNALLQAGVDILAKEGAAGLSLRQVASLAGVSHAAPYAHFADKQALMAAISTEGFCRLYARLAEPIQPDTARPQRLLMETAWAYFQFANDEPELFKLMFSGAFEQEKKYPELADMAKKCFQQVVTVTTACQAAGVLSSGPAEVVAMSVWSLVHGFVVLIREGQFSHTVLERYTVKELLAQTLGQLSRAKAGGNKPA
jgi:AcrR family transcriptional regulator